MSTEAMRSPLVYFVCTGNSCRSQMAEGFARAWGGGRVLAASGGLSPSRVHPLATAVMREVGVDISGQRSKAIDPELVREATVVVTLCGEADEACPATPPHVLRLHWPLPDPARAEGTEEERLRVFRAVRDEIAGRVKELLDGPPDARPLTPVGRRATLRGNAIRAR